MKNNLNYALIIFAFLLGAFIFHRGAKDKEGVPDQTQVQEKAPPPDTLVVVDPRLKALKIQIEQMSDENVHAAIEEILKESSLPDYNALLIRGLQKGNAKAVLLALRAGLAIGGRWSQMTLLISSPSPHRTCGTRQFPMRPLPRARPSIVKSPCRQRPQVRLK